jgi:hypothetical protein
MLSVPAYQSRSGAADDLVGHFRRYDPGALTAVLSGCGFEDIEVRHYGAPVGYLLEAVRNRISQRRLASDPSQSRPERTAGSGRPLQPSRPVIGLANRWGSKPFRLMQRAFPGTGTGLVVLARKGS